MKYLKTCMFAFIFMLCFTPLNALASSLESLPSAQRSDHWQVIIDQPDNNDVKPKPNVYHVYSMDLKYISDADIHLERVEAYRDEPNKSQEVELFTASLENEKNIAPSFHHQNFPLSDKAEKMKVIVTWKKNDDSSHLYREEFVFKQ